MEATTPVSPTNIATLDRPSNANVKFRLAIMMFLQYAIWGAWLPLMYLFLSVHRAFSPSQIGYMFMIGGVGALIGPFIAGQIADRYFNTEKFLGISHILGGVLCGSSPGSASSGCFCCSRCCTR